MFQRGHVCCIHVFLLSKRPLNTNDLVLQSVFIYHKFNSKEMQRINFYFQTNLLVHISNFLKQEVENIAGVHSRWEKTIPNLPLLLYSNWILRNPTQKWGNWNCIVLFIDVYWVNLEDQVYLHYIFPLIKLIAHIAQLLHRHQHRTTISATPLLM